ncbi:hypothetical protein ACJW31_03G139300 [Castanea mollissima]
MTPKDSSSVGVYLIIFNITLYFSHSRTVIKSMMIINVFDFGIVLNNGLVHRPWITYDGPRRRMDIRLGSKDEDYPTKPIFFEQLDLSPFLNEYMFIGFSSSTSNLTQIHNVLSWNFTSTSQAFLRIPSTERCESKIILSRMVLGLGKLVQNHQAAS